MTDSAVPYEVVGNALSAALHLLEALRANTIPMLTYSDAPSDANQDADEQFRTAVAARIERSKPTVDRFLDASNMAEPYIADDASALLDEIKKLQKSITWAQVTYIEAPPGRVLASVHVDGFGAAPQKEIDRLRVEARRLLRPRPEFNPPPLHANQARASSFRPMLNSPTTTNTILFMAANPIGTDERALGEQARAIQGELERSGYRDRFAFETRWAAQPLDLLRDMVKRKPTVVHICGGRLKDGGGEPTAGVYIQGADGSAQLVPGEALADAFESVGSVKLVILDACYSEHYADAIAAHIDCVIGMTGDTVDQAATSFSIGLYGGIGEGESVAAAFKQGRAAIGMTRVGDSRQPQLRVRPGVDASQIILANLGNPVRVAQPGGDRLYGRTGTTR